MEKRRISRKARRSGFDEAFKRKIVQEYHQGGETLKAIGMRHGISRSTVAKWLNTEEQQRQQLLTLAAMEAENTGAADAGNTTGEAPDAGGLKALQQELRLAQIKLACLETLIDITERDLGIDIRKKAGTRSSAA